MKPIILTIEETKAELIKTINSAIEQGVPCYFLEPILTDLLVQVKNGAKMELEQATAMENEEKTPDTTE